MPPKPIPIGPIADITPPSVPSDASETVPVVVMDGPMGMAAEGMMLALVATGMGPREAFLEVLALCPIEDAKPCFLAHCPEWEGADAVSVLNHLALRNPGVANAWLNEALSASRIQPWDNGFGRVGIHLPGRQWVTSLPADLRVGGCLTLTGCDALVELPPGLHVENNLYLAGCHGLKTVPSDLSVGGSLNLSDCRSLESLPPLHLRAGDLVLDGCTAMRSLPAGLKVKGDLKLDGCSHLASLPGGLDVGALWMDECDAWDGRVPDDLRVATLVYVPGFLFGTDLATWREAAALP